jgi:hypothetical protein
VAVVVPGIGRNLPEQHKWTPDKNYSEHIDWPFVDTKTWTRRTANRPLHLRKGTPAVIKRKRNQLSDCARKWSKLSDEQKAVWKTICARITRVKHKGLTHSWTRTGRLAFMSSCLLGYIRSCDRQDTFTDSPDKVDIIMFGFKIVDINKNPINKASVKITSQTTFEKDGSNKIFYNQKTAVTGYPASFGVAVNFEPYDINVFKVYESQRKTVILTESTSVDIIMC